MKVTIRNVDKVLWEQAKHDCITEGKSLGQMVNEGLVARKLCKQLADWNEGKFGKESNTKIIEISKSASALIAQRKD